VKIKNQLPSNNNLNKTRPLKYSNGRIGFFGQTPQAPTSSSIVTAEVIVQKSNKIMGSKDGCKG
jgi:hypothetical protein